MTDNEIIKALKCCINNKCSNCPLRKMACSETVAMENALDLIYRQKAEIKRLRSMNQAKLDMIHDVRAELENAKAEARKEFAEALNEKLYSFPTVYNSAFRKMVDNLVKEIIEKGR